LRKRRTDRRRSLVWCVLAVACVGACSANSTVDYPQVAQVESRALLQRPDGVTVQHGGYGSAIAAVPGRPGFIYLLVDRGPNVDTSRPDEKAFLVPRFVPHIGLFELTGQSLARVAIIEMQDAAGRPLSGLPNAVGHSDIEKAVDADGRPLAPDPAGVDPEGLVAVSDGTFWISDEYGPYLLHLDASGREVERLSPLSRNQHGRGLPRVFARRRLNYGIEGLALTPDGTTLVAIMQSALDNPNRDVRASTRSTRLLTIDLRSGETRQFIYSREHPDFSVTEIAALSAHVFLVVERDDGFATDEARPARHKHVYRIDLSRASDISDPADGEAGRLVAGKTIEQLTELERERAGIVAADKQRAFDLLALPQGYPHDKPEGLALLEGKVLAVANDDDFGIDSDAQGMLVRKTIPGIGTTDHNEVHFIPIDRLK
jgi:hypothetical protein